MTDQTTAPPSDAWIEWIRVRAEKDSLRFGRTVDIPVRADLLLGLLSKLRAPVAVPQGYALVPIVPTPEMLDAADERVGAWQHEESRAAYSAMVGAAPVASAPVAGYSIGIDAYRTGAGEVTGAFRTRAFSSPVAGGAQPGYAIVPIEPTKEMLSAAFDLFELSVPEHKTGNDARRAIYMAMVNAAPQASKPWPVEEQPDGTITSVDPEDLPRVDALTAQWDDDGATRGSAYIELRNLARALEQKHDDLVAAVAAAKESLFAQCCSNPIKNWRGDAVDLTVLNQLFDLATKEASDD